MPKQLAKLLHDWVRVKLDPVPKENTSGGGIVLVEPIMVRTGVVVGHGPGKRYVDGKYIPTQVKVGERVAFFTGNMDTKQGRGLRAYVRDDEALLPEPAILFAFDLDDGDTLPRIEK
jgi:co-chaperonin GroES (HSP10)